MFYPLKTHFWKYHQLILSAFLLLFAFIKLGQHPIYPWDEARTGVNAIEMLINHDWVNLHYAGQPDHWRAKPPLVVWCVAGSFSLFGFNEFSLRLPSAIAIIFAFFFTYKTIRLYKNEKFAFWTCMMLLTAKGMIGWHVGRTGDFDAMLVFVLLAGLYNFPLMFLWR
ncbi:MAG TPA: phospholipid carrier-dependent glycosyltransferase [Bacteroidetes bacterium]|nr:phospholipid carrier-dependent glycosyltransferase [Bacteroidota bacterium]